MMATTTRRGKFSTASSVLLLCAALLLTKSLGILALSGDGDSIQLPGQADAWSETTTISEGSGWEVTTDQAEHEELTTTAIEEVETTTDNAAPEEVETTVSPNEPEPQPETTAQPVEEPSSSSPSKESEATTVPSEDKPSSVPSEDSSTAANTPVPSEDPSTSTTTTTITTTEAAVIPTITPTPPAPPVFECQASGVFPHISGDCQRFHNCLLDPTTGELLAFDMLCPPLAAFSPTYGRCLRDVSSCTDDGFTCLAPGRFAGSDDSFYYMCVATTQGVGFHKYIVRCSSGTRFEPLLGRCWRYDWTQFLPGQVPLESSDLAAIKREQKEFKMEEKLRLKAEKNKEKEARRQQKLEEKAAKKAAKEQAKKEAKANKPLSLESVESLEQFSNGF
ncbi:hypothetical protein ACLKA7_001667 [Drosophila subpalustris]